MSSSYKTPIFSIVLIFLSLSIFTSFTASATNGYFSHGKSIIEKSQAGAGVAQHKLNFGLNVNPASFSSDKIISGWEVGISLFSPSRSYQVNGEPSAPIGTQCNNQCPFSLSTDNKKINSENNLFLIPQLTYRYQIDSNSSVTWALFGNGGMNSEYKSGQAYFAPQGTVIKAEGTFGNGIAGVDLAQLFTSVGYSHNFFDNKLALGINALFAYQRFEATGLGNFAGFSTSPTKITNNKADSSYGFGIKVGLQYRVFDQLSLGASYQTRMSMSEFDDYAGLFAQQGSFDIPSNWVIGLAYSLSDKSELLVDFERINYQDVSSISNSITKLTNGTCLPTAQGGIGAGCLGSEQGAGFGWQNMNIVKLAYSYQFSDSLTLRAGYSTTNQPIPAKEVLFAILAPAVIEQHYTAGFSYQASTQHVWHSTLMYAPANTLRASNPFDPGQTIAVTMVQVEFSAAYQYLF